MFGRETLEEFGDALASPEPTPGGGAASALAGAMGCGAAAMVARISLRHDGPAREALERMADELDEARHRFLSLADSDAEGYAAVAQALKLPRATPEERARRAQVLETALERATYAPFATAELAVWCLGCLATLAREGASMTASDVTVAAALLRACVDGSAATVLANTAWMKQQELAEELTSRADQLRTLAHERAAQASQLADAALR